MRHEPSPADSGVTIWHNPDCGTSRNVLALIRATGVEPLVRLYLEQPPTLSEIADMAAAAGLSARELLRTRGTPAERLGLTNPAATDGSILDAMAAHPLLIDRPLVRGPRGVVLARPSEKVLDVLDGAVPDGFVKEDGEPVAPRTPR